MALVPVSAYNDSDQAVETRSGRAATGNMTGPDRQGAILRTRALEDMAAFLETLRAMGVTVVSSGKGAIVVEAPAAVLETLHQHPDILSVDEPRQMQMRPPSD